MIIIVTLILKLTKSLEAGIKEKLSEENHNIIFENLINICDEKGKKYDFIDSTEDFSHVLEFKVFYLLGILVFKNSTVKQILNEKFEMFEFFERKANFYSELIGNVLENIEKISKAKIISIKKSFTKFCEFVFYYFKVDNDERLKNLKVLLSLNKLVNEKREALLINDTDFDVFKWIKKETTVKDI